MLVNNLVKLLDAFAGLKVLVIGEAMLDCYLEGFSDRLCPEAPVPVINITDQKQVPGGAANTAVNIHTLSGLATFLSVIGNDWEGATLRRSLEEQGVATKDILTHPGRRTLTKQRVMAASQLLVRFDQGSTDAVDSETEQALIEQLERYFPECDAVIVSDYGYGILTERVIGAIAKLQYSYTRILVVDSKRLTAYRHANLTAVKPNYKEAVQLLGIEVLQPTSLLNRETRADQIARYGERLLDLTNAQIVAVTLDAEGAIIFERNRPAYRTYAQTANQSRATGAGDTFVSALTLALAATTTPIAIDLASSAAALVVGKDGTTACSINELREMYVKEQGRLEAPTEWGLRAGEQGRRGDYLPFTATEKYVTDVSSLIARVASYRASGRRIVFTNGCFDILHAGHVSYLNRARLLGDILIIGVNSDLSVSRLKGPTRPINSLCDRIQVLAGLHSVDCLISFDQDTPISLIQIICPDVYTKGGDYTKETLPEAPIVEQLGGVVKILPFVENRSTTAMIERICKAQVQHDSLHQ